MDFDLDLGLGATPPRGGGGGAWNPDDYFAGGAWLGYWRADAAHITKDGSNLVAAWANLGTGDLSLRYTGFFDARKPTFVATDADLGGNPSVSFDGTQNFLSLFNGDGTLSRNIDQFWDADDKILIAVTVPVASGTDSADARSNDYGVASLNWTSLGYSLRGSGATKSLCVAHYDGSEDQSAHVITYGEPLVVVARHNGVNLLSSINGGAEASVASGNSGSLAETLRVGSKSDTTQSGQQKIALLAMTNNHNPANLASAVARLKTYYGIA